MSTEKYLHACKYTLTLGVCLMSAMWHQNSLSNGKLQQNPKTFSSTKWGTGKYTAYIISVPLAQALWAPLTITVKCMFVSNDVTQLS